MDAGVFDDLNGSRAEHEREHNVVKGRVLFLVIYSTQQQKLPPDLPTNKQHTDMPMPQDGTQAPLPADVAPSTPHAATCLNLPPNHPFNTLSGPPAFTARVAKRSSVCGSTEAASAWAAER